MSDQPDEEPAITPEDGRDRDDEKERDEATREGIAEDNSLERAIGHEHEEEV